MAAQSTLEDRFIQHWGGMATRWGVNRTVAQIQALLYLRGRPMNAEEIAAALEVARSNVSASLRELQNWDLIRVVHLKGDRRDHFETAQDPWALLRILVRERKAREFDPTVAFLRDCVSSPEFERADPRARKQVTETLALMEALGPWADQMLSMDDAALKRLVKLGAKMRSLLKAA
ncbi:MAG TPA: MarR family transcriptional regulator [Burkholderiales bacterium]|jgi:DNA-binding transcriptional regulator GbsR (MarR family)|nr:MarR family transcriptional regulator [Burkholderiales bacterium]